MTNYRVGDFLIQIKNAGRAGKRDVEVAKTKLIEKVAKVLKEEGFLSEVKIEDGLIKVRLSFSHKEPRLMDIKLISRPGLRIYANVDELKKSRNNGTILIVSTSRGIMSSTNCLKERRGGEVIAEIL